MAKRRAQDRKATEPASPLVPDPSDITTAYDAHAFKNKNPVVGRIEPLSPAEESALEAFTPLERARFLELAAETRRVREGQIRRPLTLAEFVNRISGGRFKWYTYALVLADVLQRVADGVLKRVMVFAPPRHGKSEIVSRYFPAYYLYRHPEHFVALVSYGQELANRLSRSARTNYFAFRQQQTKGAVKLWETGQGGGLQAAGIGGTLTGSGFHLGIIDDPIKDAEEASSERIRQRNKDWWQSVFYTRAEPGAAIVIIQTRWHEDDLAGWLLQQEWEEAESPDDSEPERWHIVNFEAIKSSTDELAHLAEQDGHGLFPPTCTVEPDWREAGEALSPLRYPAERLERTKRRVGQYYWAALYQQRPRPKSGLVFKIDKIVIVDPPAVVFSRLRVVRYWDKAATTNVESDFTVGTLVGYDDIAGLVYLLDMQRGQWTPGERDRRIVETYTRDKAQWGDDRLQTWGEQEPGASGVDAAIAFRKLIVARGGACYFESVSGSKGDRADPLASAVDSGVVRMLRAPWNPTLRRELADFPYGQHDDIVDSASGGYNKLHRAPDPNQIAPSVSQRYVA
jgi:predicted phage terminase large subunit-like protein